MKLTSVTTCNQSFKKRAGEITPEKSQKQVKTMALAGAVVGSVLPYMIIRKSQGLSIPKNALKGKKIGEKISAIWKSLNVDYNLKEILLVSSSSLLGGTLAGSIFEKNKENNKEKVKEAIFTMGNILIPTTITDFCLKSFKKLNLKSPVDKILAPIVGIAIGMPIAGKITSKILKKCVDKDMPEKKPKPLDYLVHIDDVFGVLVLAKVPFADKLQASKVLTAIYGYFGYKAGTSQKHVNNPCHKEPKSYNI